MSGVRPTQRQRARGAPPLRLRDEQRPETHPPSCTPDRYFLRVLSGNLSGSCIQHVSAFPSTSGTCAYTSRSAPLSFMTSPDRDMDSSVDVRDAFALGFGRGELRLQPPGEPPVLSMFLPVPSQPGITSTASPHAPLLQIPAAPPS
ncbi:hypothetical protein C8T65DRAFT_106492 [Cerioporus squamosus]|nr:hypothetical protein C8T65DRAFT_106492 [Cerioporus squamosus]